MAALTVGQRVFVANPEGTFAARIESIDPMVVVVRTASANRFAVTASGRCGYWLLNSREAVVFGNVEAATEAHGRHNAEIRQSRIDYMNRCD